MRLPADVPELKRDPLLAEDVLHHGEVLPHLRWKINELGEGNLGMVGGQTGFMQKIHIDQMRDSPHGRVAG